MEVTAYLMSDPESLFEEMDAAVVAASPVLGADPAIAAEARASNRANLRGWATAIVEGDDDPGTGDVPPEALAVARDVVRRGLPKDALLTAYRAAHEVAWRHWMEAAMDRIADPRELRSALTTGSRLSFAYVDNVLTGIDQQIERERDALAGGALARRAETIRLILDGAPIDVQRAGAQLNYRFEGPHTALVLWIEGPEPEHGALERAAGLLARAAGAQRPLTLPIDPTTLWAWLAIATEQPSDALRDAISCADPSVRATTGPSGDGIAGFRHSHHAAITAQRLLTWAVSPHRLTAYAEVEVVALAAREDERARAFVSSTLGDLAGADEATQRLRETMRVFLQEGENAPRAAERLFTHRNTVLNRIARAEELLGHPVAARRLQVALAIELAHWLGPQVLPKS